MPASGRLGVGTVVRWLLMLVLAFDLIGSPLHAHHHEGATDSAGRHGLHVDAATGDRAATHVDADDDHALGHSLLALLAAAPQPGPWVPGVFAVLSVFSTRSPADRAPLQVLTGPGWNAGPDRIPIPHDLHLRPDGRAPPILHI